MIKLCRQAGLLPPEFEQRAGQFVLTIWLNPLTEKKLTSLNLNERQIEAIKFVKQYGHISRKEYASTFSVSPRQALLDLAGLVTKKVLSPQGQGRAARYSLRK